MEIKKKIYCHPKNENPNGTIRIFQISQKMKQRQFHGIPRDEKFDNLYNISWNNDKKFHECDYMNINDAIIKRIEEICKKYQYMRSGIERRKITVCDIRFD